MTGGMHGARGLASLPLELKQKVRIGLQLSMLRVDINSTAANSNITRYGTFVLLKHSDLCKMKATTSWFIVRAIIKVR
jgi:hypothetical protein